MQRSAIALAIVLASGCKAHHANSSIKSDEFGDGASTQTGGAVAGQIFRLHSDADKSLEQSNWIALLPFGTVAMQDKAQLIPDSYGDYRASATNVEIKYDNGGDLNDRSFKIEANGDRLIDLGGRTFDRVTADADQLASPSADYPWAGKKFVGKKNCVETAAEDCQYYIQFFRLNLVVANVQENPGDSPLSETKGKKAAKTASLKQINENLQARGSVTVTFEFPPYGNLFGQVFTYANGGLTAPHPHVENGMLHELTSGNL